ncbi:putative RNA-binding protein 15B [Nibea albiflora]|uniref:RNA-binding protein 15B n=1 Tax=Nibea albiflora TaxID=240163 RepID=A0ACB7EZQ7_NIBAL|nr:putative RNA-binding protein 15B [Nibea albiflora]
MTAPMTSRRPALRGRAHIPIVQDGGVDEAAGRQRAEPVQGRRQADTGAGAGGARGGRSCRRRRWLLLLAESRGYHRRSRSREREKPRLREERAAALELHHRHELSLLGRPPLRTTAATATAAAAAELPAARPGTLEYKTLLISNLGSQVSDEDVEDALFHEFKKFGDVSVKLSHTPELGRIAYVNFRHPEDAKEARHAKSSRLVLGDRQLKIEPMYVRRRSVTPPDVGYLPLHAPYPYRQRSLSPPGPGVSNIRDLRARHYALETLGLSRERGEAAGLLRHAGRAGPALRLPPDARGGGLEAGGRSESHQQPFHREPGRQRYRSRAEEGLRQVRHHRGRL